MDNPNTIFPGSSSLGEDEFQPRQLDRHLRSAKGGGKSRGRSRQLSEQHRSWSLFCRLAAAGGAARIWIGIVEWEGEKQVGLDDLKGFKGI